MIGIAARQAIASIRVRLGRQLATAAGIALGIAFTCSMRVAMSSPGALQLSNERVAWLLGSSLLMCLVGVSNAMLLSVAERTREIGTIKCLGASDGLIVAIFLIEALLIGAAASVVGSVAGAWLTARWLVVAGHAAVSVWPEVWQGVALGVVITAVSAIVPAVQAARMPAAAALRVEI